MFSEPELALPAAARVFSKTQLRSRMYVHRRQRETVDRDEREQEEIRHKYIGTWDVQQARDTRSRRKRDP